MASQFKIRNATIKDVKKICQLISRYAKNGIMLHRKEIDVIMNLRDYFVAVKPKSKKIYGCASLHIYSDRLSEIKGLAVHPSVQGVGLGQRLVKRCIQEAKDLGLPKVFALTYAVHFFEKLKFIPSNKEQLPEKIWKECEKCAKYSCCDENCLVYIVN